MALEPSTVLSSSRSTRLISAPHAATVPYQLGCCPHPVTAWQPGRAVAEFPLRTLVCVFRAATVDGGSVTLIADPMPGGI